MTHKRIFPSLSNDSPSIFPSATGAGSGSPCLTGCQRAPGPGSLRHPQPEPQRRAAFAGCRECEPGRRHRLPAAGAPSSLAARPTHKDAAVVQNSSVFSATHTQSARHSVQAVP